MFTCRSLRLWNKWPSRCIMSFMLLKKRWRLLSPSTSMLGLVAAAAAVADAADVVGAVVEASDVVFVEVAVVVVV